MKNKDNVEAYCQTDVIPNSLLLNATYNFDGIWIIATQTELSFSIHYQGFVSLLLEEPLFAYFLQHQSLATWLQFGPIASSRSFSQHLFGWPLGLLWSHGHHYITHLVHLLSFSHKTCSAHQCLLVQIWWITSMIPVFEQIQLALFLSCSVSPIIIHSILHYVVTIFWCCILLRDQVHSCMWLLGVCIHSALSFSTSAVCFCFT